MSLSADHLLILGAGASVPYGLPTLKALTWQLADSLQGADRTTFLQAVSEACGVSLKPGTFIDFEELLNRLDPSGLSYLDESYLGKTLQDRRRAFDVCLAGLISFIQGRCDQAKDKPGPYDRVVATLDQHSAIVSFNWDVLLERAFLRAGKEYVYLPTEAFPNAHLVLKPHGSINWRALLDRELLQVSIASNLWSVGELTNYILYRPDPFRPIDFKASSPFVELALSKAAAIVPPRSAKVLSVGGTPRDGFVENGHTRTMKEIWRTFAELARTVRTIVVVGYSMPGTDGAAITVLRSALASRKSPFRLLVVDPDEGVRNRYESLLGLKVEMPWTRFEDFDPTRI